MRKTYYYCDRCGKEIDDKKLYNVSIFAVRSDLLSEYGRREHLELCVDCLHEIEAVIFKDFHECSISRLTGIRLKKEAV